MHLGDLLRKVEKLARDNSPVILTAIGVSGTITTAVLTGKATIKAYKEVQEKEVVVYSHRDDDWSKKEIVKLTWKFYIPAGLSAGMTIGCIIGAAKVGARRTAAITAAYSLSERAFSEYKEKVVEKIGSGKEQSVRDDIAKEKVLQSAPSKEVIVVGNGNVLCCELHTGRYFNADMETLRKAENDINAQLIREVDATLNDFYYMVKLPQTDSSGYFGWNADKLLALDFTTTLTEDGRPCLAFAYNYLKAW